MQLKSSFIIRKRRSRDYKWIKNHNFRCSSHRNITKFLIGNSQSYLANSRSGTGGEFFSNSSIS